MSVDRTLRAARIAHAGGLATDALIADERGDRAEAKALMAEAEALLALPAEIAPTPEESEPRRLLVEAERLLVALADPDLTPEESKRLAGTLPEARRLVEESERLLAALAEGAPTAEESERLLALPMEAQRLLAEADRAIWEWAASGEGDPPPKRGRGQPRKPNVEVANMLMEIAVADTPTIVAAAERVATLNPQFKTTPARLVKSYERWRRKNARRE